MAKKKHNGFSEMVIFLGNSLTDFFKKYETKISDIKNKFNEDKADIFGFEIKELIVNPEKVISEIKNHLEDYLESKNTKLVEFFIPSESVPPFETLVFNNGKIACQFLKAFSFGLNKKLIKGQMYFKLIGDSENS